MPYTTCTTCDKKIRLRPCRVGQFKKNYCDNDCRTGEKYSWAGYLLANMQTMTGAEMAAVLKANPFPGAATNRTVAIFLDAAPPANALDFVSGRKNEETALGLREIYVHYGDGQADSKLKIPAAKTGTARNMNTVAKLAEWAA